MTPELYHRVRDICHRACELSGPAQDGLLERECGGNAELLAEVRSLLRHHEEQNDALSDAQLGFGRKLLDDALRDGDAATGPAARDDVPERIGRYRIIRRIGEGGMGIVFEAEQDHPTRKVALKLVRLGFGSKALFRRFQHEAEMLGRLRHPGIAHIYDAGLHHTPTRAQIPYLAMELIDGVSLTEYVERKALSARERLDLFAKVCDAIEHAHQNGVIHRDLKPGNVLVEAGGQPKVLDFGIARATDADIRTTTMQTSVGQLLGTMPYMSPEQASGDPAVLDTRSDVYALGVMLYEFLTGRLPYDLAGRSVADVVRIIQQSEPARVSSLNQAFRGDIETILGKALEKEKDRRYGSAADLAADIRRHLDDLPLIARPPTAMYQLSKFARRNRLLVGATLICLGLLAVGIIGTSVGLISARRANQDLQEAIVEAEIQRDLSRQNEARATTELTKSRQVAGFLRWMLRSANPSIAKGRDVTLLREILENTIKRLDGGELEDQPAVEAEMRAIVAETFSGLGDNLAALSVIEPAIALARAAPASQAPDYQRVRILYASTLGLWGLSAEARDIFEECVQAIKRGAVKEDDDAAVLYSNYAVVAASLGDAEKALELHRMAMDNRRRFKGEDHLDVAASMGNIAATLQDLKRYDEAYPMMSEVLARYQTAEPPRLLHVTIAETMMADLLLAMGNAVEAEGHIRAALDTGPKVLSAEHHQLGECNRVLGLVLQAQDRHEEACEAFARAVDILSHAFDEGHPAVFAVRLHLGKTLTQLGRFAEAERELLDVHASLSGRRGSAENTLKDCTTAIVKMYETWHQAEPDKQHGEQARRWAARLQGIDAQTQPSGMNGS